MHNQALIWNTDTSLRVTSLTARLRGFAEIGGHAGDLHVSDLWAQLAACASPAALFAAPGREINAAKRNGSNGIKSGKAWQAHSSSARTRYVTAESA
jgi:hypothetical protein